MVLFLLCEAFILAAGIQLSGHSRKGGLPSHHREKKTILNVWTVQRSGSNGEGGISMDSTVNGNPTTF